MNINLFKDLNEKTKFIIQKLKTDKKAMVILLLGITGMLMILFSEPSNNRYEQKSVPAESVYNQNAIENDLTKLIESIQGAGETEVMITYESAEENVYATNEDVKSGENDTDIKKEYLIIETDSGETGLKIKLIYPKVRGVAVICKGGGDPIVEEKIYSLISALFDISTNKISVAPMA